ncbi:MAG: heme-copper oxidase subunit III [Planctomycetia bacterium]|nr:heme-copper oxidase subunit III [Planctomycetia bacterium]
MSQAGLPQSISPARRFERHAPTFELGAAHSAQVGMVCFLCSEVAFFGTLVVAYITYIGQSTAGPTPAEALSIPLAVANTICLVASSFTAHLAGTAMHRGGLGGFRGWLAATIALGALFLAGTAVEWRSLIFEHGLTIGRNLFGTTYYTLVGFHAAHVTVGVLLLSLMFCLSATAALSRLRTGGFEIVSWYWHFVDTVWIVVFAVVYVFGR